MKVSAIVPVYNNETTIARVAKVLQAHPQVDEVIAINDASCDLSAQLLKEIPGINVIVHRKNKGKGAAVAAGWKTAKHETLITIDADMSRLTLQHVDDLLVEYQKGVWDMVIGTHEPSTVFDWVSGQRVYRRSAVLPYAALAAVVGNGIEQVVNHAHRGRRITMIPTPNIGHVLKYQRHRPHRAAWLYLKEGWQLAKTEYLLRLKTIS